MSGKRFPTLMIASIAAIGLTIVAGAYATRTVKIDSSISIKEPSSLSFKGKVKADNPNCVADRKVELKVLVSGGPDDVTAKAKTDSKGRWSAVPNGSAGISMKTFFAKVKRSSQGTAGTIYVCKGARSQETVPGSG